MVTFLTQMVHKIASWSLAHLIRNILYSAKRMWLIFLLQIHILVGYVINIKIPTDVISRTSVYSTAFSIVRDGGYVKLSIINSHHFHVSCWDVPVLNHDPLFPHGATARSGPGSHYRGFTTTLRHTTLCRIPLDEWSAPRRDYLHNKQHSQHAHGGIRTRIPSRLKAADDRPLWLRVRDFCSALK
jgi:hypothetical protein